MPRFRAAVSVADEHAEAVRVMLETTAADVKDVTRLG
ncbi:MAG: hypothetical protein K0Q80_2707 [Microvirga sp.]|jgi:hypothetical protein|nr:hypothetical protein [Microvirga sp.]